MIINVDYWFLQTQAKKTAAKHSPFQTIVHQNTERNVVLSEKKTDCIFSFQLSDLVFHTFLLSHTSFLSSTLSWKCTEIFGRVKIIGWIFSSCWNTQIFYILIMFNFISPKKSCCSKLRKVFFICIQLVKELLLCTSLMYVQSISGLIAFSPKVRQILQCKDSNIFK